ncbi:MAG: hypothetical protein M1G31_17425 [Pseudanabaena sp. Salubria-1]|nr:hypothetical protein [Pseudanabaena sp. Salubria-1]
MRQGNTQEKRIFPKATTKVAATADLYLHRLTVTMLTPYAIAPQLKLTNLSAEAILPSLLDMRYRRSRVDF